MVAVGHCDGASRGRYRRANYAFVGLSFTWLFFFLRVGEHFLDAIDECIAMCHDRKQRGPYFVVRHRRTRYPSGPNLTRGFDNALEFPLLVVLGDHVADNVRGESALRTERKLFEGNMFCRLVNPPF